MACGGPDPLLDFGERSFPPPEGVDATVHTFDGGCDFCFDDAFAPDTAPPPEPPPVLCPVSAPLAGASCNVPDYENCEYGSSTSFFCNDIFKCVSGVWSTGEPNCQPTQACDTAADGGGCTSPGQACAVPDSGTVCVCSECGGGPPPPPPPVPFGDGGTINPSGTWQCFDPGSGCSPDRANSGTACDLPDGSLCRFVGGGCCTGVFEQCVDGVWLGGPTTPCE
jgi:hypothetical protein